MLYNLGAWSKERLSASFATDSDGRYALNERTKNREIWYLSHFKATKAQSSFCQCTDSPVLSLPRQKVT